MLIHSFIMIPTARDVLACDFCLSQSCCLDVGWCDRVHSGLQSLEDVVEVHVAAVEAESVQVIHELVDPDELWWSSWLS